MFGWFRRWRRKQVADAPTPASWIAILEEKVGFYQEMTVAQRERFLAQLKIFLAEKHFEGAQGFEITEEVKVIIAATAVRMTVYLDISMYDRLTEIVVYEGDYRHPHGGLSGDGEVAGLDGIVYGEAHSFGTVVLSWKAVVRGLRHEDDGQDTATHEFAHVLDMADGSFDGTPILRSLREFRPWAEVMSKHFLALRKGARLERKVIDEYGATNEAEFFAVISEVFFEKPEKLKRLLPDVYEELQSFYGWDLTLEPEKQPEPPSS